MSRLKFLSAAVLLIATTGLVQQAHAIDKPTLKLVVSGSSGLWQAMGLATYAYNGTSGVCPAGSSLPCYHWTGTLSLTDTRPKTFGGQANNAVDSGSTWIIWDSHTTATGTVINHLPNVWVYTKVDTAVGDRCYFAHPRCYITGTVSGAGAGSISSALWGADTDPSTTLDGPAMAAVFSGTTVVVGAAASDVRPEDALWATCRANSAFSLPLGLGYNSNIPAGQCQTAGNANVTGGKNGLEGSDIISQVNTAHTAHVVAWNISGTDPYSGTAIPTFGTVNVGGEPIVIVGSIAGGGSLNTIQNVTDQGLQTVFGGTHCNATDLGASASDALNVYLREPLSGTMQTVEYNILAYPDFSGESQETGVNPGAAGGNPLNLACPGGKNRVRGVGGGDIINGLFLDGGDAIGYSFFGYGNFTNGSKPIDDSANFRYFTLDGVDPIFHAYVSTAGQTNKDPGQPNAFVGEIPGPADLPSTCFKGAGTFPCGEDKIWNGGTVISGVTGGISFPNVRAGEYRAWSTIVYVSDGANLATAGTLLTAAQSFVASSIPEFIPYQAVLAKPSAVPPVPADPGLLLLRSHYQEVDNGGLGNLGLAPVNGNGKIADKGGAVGGCILHATPGVTSAEQEFTDATTGLTITSNVGTTPGCVVFSTH